MGLLAAFLAIGLIASLFAWCAFELAARADKAIENFPNENPDCDAASPAPQVPGGEPFLPVVGDTLINNGRS